MIFNIYVCTDLYFHGKSSVMAITNWEAAPTSNKGRRNRGAREDLGLLSIFKYVLHSTMVSVSTVQPSLNLEYESTSE